MGVSALTSLDNLLVVFAGGVFGHSPCDDDDCSRFGDGDCSRCDGDCSRCDGDCTTRDDEDITNTPRIDLNCTDLFLVE